jgi:hypothetical protein
MHLCFKIVKSLLQSTSLYMFLQERQYQQNSAGGRNQHKITR